MNFSEKLHDLKQDISALAVHDDSTDDIYQACMIFLRELDQIEFMDKAYQLHFEYFGDGALDYDDFAKHQVNHALWVYFANKIVERGL